MPLPDDVPRQLAAATLAWTKLRRACAYATFDAWSLAIFGALTMVCGGYSSVLGLLGSVALLGAAFFEFQNVGKLRRLNAQALTYLAYNQFALGGALILYAVVSLIQVARGGGMLAALNAQMGDLGQMSGQANDLAPMVLNITYSAIIAIAVLVQGGTALYYLSRRKFLKRYLEQTPPWIQQMQFESGRGVSVA